MALQDLFHDEIVGSRYLVTGVLVMLLGTLYLSTAGVVRREKDNQPEAIPDPLPGIVNTYRYIFKNASFLQHVKYVLFKRFTFPLDFLNTL